MRKIKLVGDHSDVHCGCKAVVSVLKRELEKIGVLTDDDDYDLLVVNGEGSMHHSTGPFHRKMKAIIEAQRKGSEVWLLNSVWQDNDTKFDSNLRTISIISVREIDSYEDLVRRHNIRPFVFPDISLQADIDETAESRDLKGNICMTDFYSREFSTFVRLTDGEYGRRTYLDMKRLEWSSFVKSLRTSSLLLTGRHHAVMAACVARVPFVALEGNSHKLRGFFRLAKVNIPICRAPSEIQNIIQWARENRSVYDELFDWVYRLPTWSPMASLI